MWNSSELHWLQIRMQSIYFNFEHQTETDYAPFVLLDSKINWEFKNWNVYLEVANIFNASYFDIGNVVMPGRWIRFGLSTHINYK